jgi:hypothetical protein
VAQGVVRIRNMGKGNNGPGGAAFGAGANRAALGLGEGYGVGGPPPPPTGWGQEAGSRAQRAAKAAMGTIVVLLRFAVFMVSPFNVFCYIRMMLNNTRNEFPPGVMLWV